MSIHSYEVIASYKRFCELRKSLKEKANIFIEDNFLYPTTILPLKLVLKNQIIKFEYSNVESYFEFISSSKKYKQNSYVALTKIPVNKNKRQEYIDKIDDFEGGENLGGKDPFQYVLSELIDNIYQHSEFEDAYLLCQKYPSKEFFEIVIIDNGKGIKKSLEGVGLKFTKDSEYLYQAANGMSSKGEERGRGLGTNIKLITEGMKGCFFLVSGCAALFRGPEDEKENLYQLKNEEVYKGVFITIRVPYPIKKLGGDFYEYIET